MGDDNPLTEKLVEMLEESGAKVVTVKTIEEKRLEKIREIWGEIQVDPLYFETGYKLREAMFEGKIPICLKCGKLMQMCDGNPHEWKCDCKSMKNLKLCVG